MRVRTEFIGQNHFKHQVFVNTTMNFWVTQDGEFTDCLSDYLFLKKESASDG